MKVSEQYAAAMRCGNSNRCLAIEHHFGLEGLQPELVSVGLLALEAGSDHYAAIYAAWASQPPVHHMGDAK